MNSHGQIKQAVELLEYVVTVQGRTLEEHPSRLTSQYVLKSANQSIEARPSTNPIRLVIYCPGAHVAVEAVKETVKAKTQGNFASYRNSWYAILSRRNISRAQPL